MYPLHFDKTADLHSAKMDAFYFAKMFALHSIKVSTSLTKTVATRPVPQPTFLPARRPIKMYERREGLGVHGLMKENYVTPQFAVRWDEDFDDCIDVFETLFKICTVSDD